MISLCLIFFYIILFNNICLFQFVVLYKGDECLGSAVISFCGPSYFFLDKEIMNYNELNEKQIANESV